MKLWDVVVELGLISAGGEYRRLIHNNGIKVNNEIIKNENFIVPEGIHVINVGKSKCKTIHLANGKVRLIK